ncbi:MAG: BlaI/MecI/CopY family transcriptional regulator [Gemmiger sp.]
MENHRLPEGEYRFACLVWDSEPLPSGRLAALAADALGWKKSTAYTVLKKLCERGILQNEGGTVTALVKREEVQRAESAAVVERTFGGSLPHFVAAFLNTKPISKEEAAQIRALLDAAEQEEEVR